MIRCSDEAIQQYAEGTLRSPERALVEAHLAPCATCRQALLAYKALLWDLANLPPAAVPPGLEQVGDRLMAAWEEQQAAAEAGRVPSWVPA